MSRTALEKLALAAKLSEEVARLTAEAASELHDTANAGAPQKGPITDIERAAARRRLRQLGRET